MTFANSLYRTHTKSQILAALVGACLILTLLAAPCRAATTITVNDLGDPRSSTNDCTLRDAINVAHGRSVEPDVCATSGSGSPFTIVFSASLTGDTITLRAGDLPIFNLDLIITGPTTLSSGITISGNNNDRIMDVLRSRVTLKFLTLTEGIAAAKASDPSELGRGEGGAVENKFGTLIITNCTFSSNQAIGASGSGNGSDGKGGAIANSVTATTISNSTFTSNLATGGSTDISNVDGRGGAGRGGAIYNIGGTLTISNSTFSSNLASGGGADHGFGGDSRGGAIDASTKNLTIINSTFFFNQAKPGFGHGRAAKFSGLGKGGAIFNDGSSTIASTTFLASVAGDVISGTSVVGGQGGALYNGYGTVNLKSTILADNFPEDCFRFKNTVLVDKGYNLADDSTCNFDPRGTSQITSFSAIGFGPGSLLADNGGPTQTCALVGGGLADTFIPVASCTVQSDPPQPLTTDQRGFPRPAPSHPSECSAGAFEFGAEAVTPMPIP